MAVAILVCIGIVVVLVAFGCFINGCYDEAEKEKEDLDQLRYLAEWKEKHERSRKA